MQGRWQGVALARVSRLGGGGTRRSRYGMGRLVSCGGSAGGGEDGEDATEDPAPARPWRQPRHLPLLDGVGDASALPPGPPGGGRPAWRPAASAPVPDAAAAASAAGPASARHFSGLHGGRLQIERFQDPDSNRAETRR